mmetsp:Transcript_4263/g.6714  ORF Transcript_4263/g.6714 Transcript_4263/m.6714 type:complete len:189 (-) Transcript_4263:3335-3901(-)
MRLLIVGRIGGGFDPWDSQGWLRLLEHVPWHELSPSEGKPQLQSEHSLQGSHEPESVLSILQNCPELQSAELVQDEGADPSPEESPLEESPLESPLESPESPESPDDGHWLLHDDSPPLFKPQLQAPHALHDSQEPESPLSMLQNWSEAQSEELEQLDPPPESPESPPVSDPEEAGHVAEHWATPSAF